MVLGASFVLIFSLWPWFLTYLLGDRSIFLLMRLLLVGFRVEVGHQKVKAKIRGLELWGAPGRLSQLKRPNLNFSSGHDLRVMKSSLRDSALGVEPTYDSLSLPLSAPLPPLGKRKKRSSLELWAPPLILWGVGEGLEMWLMICCVCVMKPPEKFLKYEFGELLGWWTHGGAEEGGTLGLEK